MPGFTTHYILGVKAYNQLPDSTIKSLISKYRGLYQLGLQGPDIFFYNLPILRHRDYRNVGSYMHENLVNEFFLCYLTKLTLLKSEQQRKQGLSYFCGFICHYIGDHICHPYIYGRIDYDPNNPNSASHGRHAQLENDIDAILLKKYKNKRPSEFNQTATICLNHQELQFISDFLCDCINETFYKITYRNNFQISSRSVRISIMAIKWGCRTLADPLGKKKTKIEFFENILRKEPFVSTKLITDKFSNVRTSMNLDHEIWQNPWDKEKASNASFPELFEKSVDLCKKYFQIINKNLLLSPACNITDYHQLLNELGNFSYHSGLSIR